MVFSSVIFLFLFLPLVLVAYWLLEFFFRPGRNLFLLIISLLFYTWGEGTYILLMLASIFVNYLVGLGLGEKSENPAPPALKRRRLILAVGVVANLAFLGVYKYFDFALENLRQLLALLGVSEFWQSAPSFILPLGISFYTFQAMSYLFDVYFGTSRPTKNLLNFATYISLFPQLVAGPIVRYIDIEKELGDRSCKLQDVEEGILIFLRGLAKKVLIANTLSGPVDQIFALDQADLTTPLVWLGIIGYSFQIFYDFSGYSEMAIGLGKMFGFNFPTNFNFPYYSSSIREFWRRWHITLSTWFREYLYIPLGGNRVSNFRVAMNLMIVFLLCGLWHGASWNFIIWGAWHGLFLGIERRFSFLDKLPIPRIFGILYVYIVVLIGWAFFRAETLPQAIRYLQLMFPLGGNITWGSREYDAQQLLTTPVQLAFLFAVLLSFPIMPWLYRKWQTLSQPQTPAGMALQSVGWGARLTLALAVFLLTAMQLSSGTLNPFIYFRF